MIRLLIKSGEYKLCGQYIDVDQFYKKLCQALDRDRNGPPKATARYLSQRQIQDWRDRAFRTFANDTTTLVGILALNGRNEEAGQIAARAVKQWDDPEFGKRLKEAEGGVVPQPQP